MREVDTTNFDLRDEMIQDILEKDEDGHYKGKCGGPSTCDICHLGNEGLLEPYE